MPKVPTCLIDDLPSSLFRAFDNESYCDAFLERGQVYLRLVKEFRTIGGVREDGTEGASYNLVPGDVPFVRVDGKTFEMHEAGSKPGHFHHHSEFLNPTYTYSLSNPSVDIGRLTTEFGPHVVSIHDPRALIDRIFVAAKDSSPFVNRKLAYCESFSVVYNKGEEMDLSLEIPANVRLDYGQKPRKHQWEDEYRIALVFDGALRDFAPDLTLSIGTLRDIASLHRA